MILRYEVQVAHLDDTIKKHSVEWRKVTRTLTLGGAQKHFWFYANSNKERVVYRVFDRKTGKAVV